jgi:hypothetical protein
VEHLAESQEPHLVVRCVPAGAARRERTEGGHRGVNNVMCAHVSNELPKYLFVSVLVAPVAVAIGCAACNSVCSQMRRTVPRDHFRLSAAVVCAMALI